jgi:hypothetical protein
MSKYILSIFILITSIVVYSKNSNQNSVETEVSEVTVYLEKAQVLRKKAVSLNKGVNLLKFNKLSPYVDKKTVQIKADDQVLVHSVNSQMNYLNENKSNTSTKEIDNINNRIEELDKKLKLSKTKLIINRKQQEFLQLNREVSSEDNKTKFTAYKQTYQFYVSEFSKLKLDEIKHTEFIQNIEKEKSKLVYQRNSLTTTKNETTTEVIVKVDVEKAGNYNFELKYLVENASWYPIYDLRAKNINEPLELVYKAVVKQDTKVDWNNVKLSFSSTNPNKSGVSPELKPWILDYYSYPPKYFGNISSVSGIVVDSNGEPIPGSNVSFDNSTVGTVTDVDGKFNLIVPKNKKTLKISFIGFENKFVQIDRPYYHIKLKESKYALEEVAVVGFAQNMKGKIRGVKTQKNFLAKSQQRREVKKRNLRVDNHSAQSSVNFKIKTPYTIKSDNKSYTVSMMNYDLSTHYEYLSIPKIEKSVFLIAKISDWEKLNLLEAEANIYFENAYVGKTIMSTKDAGEQLEISMGVDESISIKRKNIKSFKEEGGNVEKQ